MGGRMRGPRRSKTGKERRMRREESSSGDLEEEEDEEGGHGDVSMAADRTDRSMAWRWKIRIGWTDRIEGWRKPHQVYDGGSGGGGSSKETRSQQQQEDGGMAEMDWTPRSSLHNDVCNDTLEEGDWEKGDEGTWKGEEEAEEVSVWVRKCARKRERETEEQRDWDLGFYSKRK